jgi:hypothetical protein
VITEVTTSTAGCCALLRFSRSRRDCRRFAARSPLAARQVERTRARIAGPHVATYSLELGTVNLPIHDPISD